MIRATELSGRAVVDMDVAEKLGRIDRIILDPDARQVAGYQISRGGAMLGNETLTTVPAGAVHAIGPDAVTVHHPAELAVDSTHLDRLPRLSDLIGRKVVSREGRLLGVVDDVLISGADGRIVGYQLADTGLTAKVEHLLGARKRQRVSYLRADADLRTGRDLIVAPEDAISTWDDEPSSPSTLPPADAPSPRGEERGAGWFRDGDGVEPSKPLS